MIPSMGAGTVFSPDESIKTSSILPTLQQKRQRMHEYAQHELHFPQVLYRRMLDKYIGGSIALNVREILH